MGLWDYTFHFLMGLQVLALLVYYTFHLNGVISTNKTGILGHSCKL